MTQKNMEYIVQKNMNYIAEKIINMVLEIVKYCAGCVGFFQTFLHQTVFVGVSLTAA